MKDFNLKKKSINLPKNLSEFEECINQPFCIFEKKNFLDNDLYKNLLLNFPSEDQFPAIHSNGNKKFLNNAPKSLIKERRRQLREIKSKISDTKNHLKVLKKV